MSDFSAQDVQKLRHEAGVGMMDAKKALEEAGGDLEAALELLAERGLVAVTQRADRAGNHGTVGYYIHRQQGRPVAGVLVDLACETDFVAKSDEFVAVANDIALHISWGRPAWVDRSQADDAEIEAKTAQFAAQAEEEDKPADLIPKIVTGKIEKHLSENTLIEQVFVNPEKFEGTVGEMISRLAAKMGENIGVRRFARVSVDEQER